MKYIPDNEWLVDHPEFWFLLAVACAWIGAGAIEGAMSAKAYWFEFELMVAGTLIGTALPLAVAVKVLDWTPYTQREEQP